MEVIRCSNCRFVLPVTMKRCTYCDAIDKYESANIDEDYYFQPRKCCLTCKTYHTAFIENDHQAGEKCVKCGNLWSEYKLKDLPTSLRPKNYAERIINAAHENVKDVLHRSEEILMKLEKLSLHMDQQLEKDIDLLKRLPPCQENDYILFNEKHLRKNVEKLLQLQRLCNKEEVEVSKIEKDIIDGLEVVQSD